MSLDNIYDKTDSARDNLVNAIRTMGVSVAADSTINQCANAILMIPAGGGGDTKFYKCASVDTTTKTWTGYELILSDGVYTVSTTLTSGLSYTSITPVVGTVYSEDALVKVAAYAQNIPTDGLVFYAPLSSDSTTAETGQSFTPNGTVSYTVNQGIPCIILNNYTGHFADTNMPSGSASRTLSCWVKRESQNTVNEATFFAYGTGSTRQAMDLCCWDDSFGADTYNYALFGENPISHTVWHHILYTFDESTSTAELYVDNSLIDIKTDSGYIPNTSLSGKVYLGVGDSGDWGFGNGWLAACRVYNRVVNANERMALASEFTPTE